MNALPRHLPRTAALLCALALPTAAVADPGHGTSDIGRPGTAGNADRTVEVVMHDNYYEPLSVEVKAGESIRFVVGNAGALLHEFNIGTAAMHAEHQAMMAEMMKHGMITKTRIVPEMMNMDHSKMGLAHDMKHDDPNSVLVEPGKTAELVWQFTAPARLEFACNMPGHYEVGMSGAIHFHK
jgi:uncharacterized cupredoxin-like copper-binding protein